VVFSRDRFPINQTVIMMTPDRRSVFAVPREGFVYLGTTDTFYPKPEYWPEITREDIDYLVSIAVRDLDVGPLKDDDIVSLWSGIRPLLGVKGKKPSEISRRNEVIKGPTGLLTVAGGKLTSYRSMAERVVNECEKELGQKPSPCTTTDEPLPGGDFTGTFEDLQSRLEGLGLSPHEAERAARLYGSEALGLFKKERSPAVEAAHAVKYEGALTLEDYWVRRSARARFDEDGGLASLEPSAESMGELLNWPHEEKTLQIQECRKRRAEEMSPVREL
jgi:glycerol-3-phosphate dehydrogenase